MKISIFSLRLLLISFTLLWSAGTAFAQMPQPQGGNLFTGKDAQAFIQNALSKQGVGDDLQVSINATRPDDTLASASGTISAQVDGLEVDSAQHRWQTTLLLTADGKNLAPLKLSGRFDEMSLVPMFKRPVKAGEVISEEDIDWNKQSALHLQKNTVMNAQALIGHSPKHTISQGRPIRTDEIASPAIVSKGAQVTLFYKSANIEIKTFGQTLDSGAKGDVIRVRNLASKTVIEGTVESGDRVRVSSPESDSAEAM